MKISAKLQAVLAIGLGVAVCGPAPAQVSPKWEVPDELIRLDFSPQNLERRVRFLDDGMALEIALDFLMLRHNKIQLVADLPEAGQFKVVQANPNALVDVTDLPVKGDQGKAEVVARVAPLGPSEVTAQARAIVGKFWDPVERKERAKAQAIDKRQILGYLERKLGTDGLGELLDFGTLGLPAKKQAKAREKIILEQYVFDRTLQQLLPDIRNGLTELAKRRPGWISDQEQLGWKTADGRRLRDTYLELLECEIMDAHLKLYGLGVAAGTVNLKAKVQSRFDAVHVATSGKAGTDPQASRRLAAALSPHEIKRLRDALTVQLRCRLYPKVDPKDPNAQWFAAQRVACRAKGVSLIRVEGKLDPANHDAVDWWILEGYSPTSVSLRVEKKPEFRVDPPYPSKHGARLRVVATGKGPAGYAIEFRPTNPPRSNVKVVIHESPASADARFPF